MRRVNRAHIGRIAAALLLLAGSTAAPAFAQAVPAPPRMPRIFTGSATPPAVTITISPASPTVQPGSMVQFTAVVSGTPNTAITWSATGGTITQDGSFTAGQTEGSYAVTATLTGGTIARTIAVTVGAGLTLTESGAMTSSRNGQVIENLRIRSATTGLTIRHTDVIVRNVEIEHADGPGIHADNAARLRIENVNIIHTDSPASGPNPDDQRNNITIAFSPDVVVTRVRVTRGSAGIHLLESPRARLSFVECHDARGPFPRGQCVQFDKSPDSLLEDFSYTRKVGASWEEDNISVFHSSNVTVRRGLIDGNNSPSGIGVMFEQSSSNSGGLVEDVDALRMGNGAFSGYPARNVTFRRTRARDNICSSQDGRGAPMSNALVWAGEPSQSSGLRIEASAAYALCNPGNLVWDRSKFTVVEVSSTNFTPRAPVRLVFAWE